MTVRCRRDQGFTLIEIVVAIAVTGLVVGGLSVALVSAWHSNEATFTRLVQSHDAQLAASYIVADTINAGAPGSISTTTDAPPCADSHISGSPSSAWAVLSLNWNDPSISAPGGSSSKNVTYLLIGNVLRRVFYTPSTETCDDSVVGHYVASASATCTIDGSNWSSSDCSLNPQAVTVTVTESATIDCTGPQTSAYSYSLTGKFRLVPPGGSLFPGSTPPPTSLAWLTLGSDATCSNSPFGLDASTHFNVSGSVAINGSSPMVVSNGDIEIDGDAELSPSSTQQDQNAHVADPLAALPAPTSSRQDNTGNLADGPGEYTTPVTVYSTNSPPPLAPGIYIFDSGIRIGRDVTITNAPGGVMFYLAGGGIRMSRSSGISLTAPGSGTYSNIVISQSRSDPAVDMFNGNGTIHLDGVVYVPDGEVELTGSLSIPSVGSIIAECGHVTGSGNVAIGPPPSF